jgi:hypothetical protein
MAIVANRRYCSLATILRCSDGNVKFAFNNRFYAPSSCIFNSPRPHTQAFVVPSIGRPALLAASTSTSLDASRINAKQEKRKRNRENMRKFKKGGKKGTSKKKMMRKLQSGAARQVENEFIAKCFMTVSPPNSDEKA